MDRSNRDVVAKAADMLAGMLALACADQPERAKLREYASTLPETHNNVHGLFAEIVDQLCAIAQARPVPAEYLILLDARQWDQTTADLLDGHVYSSPQDVIRAAKELGGRCASVEHFFDLWNSGELGDLWSGGTPEDCNELYRNSFIARVFVVAEGD